MGRSAYIFDDATYEHAQAKRLSVGPIALAQPHLDSPCSTCRSAAGPPRRSEKTTVRSARSKKVSRAREARRAVG
jgi:hypothetical protein